MGNYLGVCGALGVLITKMNSGGGGRENRRDQPPHRYHPEQHNVLPFHLLDRVGSRRSVPREEQILGNSGGISPDGREHSAPDGASQRREGGPAAFDFVLIFKPPLDGGTGCRAPKEVNQYGAQGGR